MTESGRVLALDLGEKRVGAALSDALRITAQPYKTIDFVSNDRLLDAVRAIVESESVMEIVIGLPKRLDGSHGDKAKQARVIADRLRDELGLPVKLWDERFSTHAAQRVLLQGDVSRKKRKKVIDQTAAAWILQGYLDSRP
ncbi:MAG: Holliday junction resolvase RuvX [bacterium]|nr:Holliday junction resolvase RuvX [bacterium]